jgi:hypothetical protein
MAWARPIASSIRGTVVLMIECVPDQVAGEHLGNPLVREHLLAGERERLSHQVDLPAKPQACGFRRPGDRRLHALSGRRRGAC